MDFNDYWQENKRFLLTLAGGVIVFFIGKSIVNNVYRSEREAAQRSVDRDRSSLVRDARYQAVDERQAREENEALTQAVERLKTATAFQPRPDFVLDSRKGTPSNQYFGRVDRVREELEVLASRRGTRLPDGLGLEIVKTNSSEAIERHLEAIDLIDRALRHALDAGVERVEKIRVRLDPGFDSRRGVGAVERTAVELKLVSSPEAVVSLLDASQGDRFGNPLTIGDLTVVGARSTTSEVTANITFYVIRVRETLVEDAS